MSAIVPSKNEVYDNAAFESLLWSMSRPGLIRELPEAGEQPIVRSLIDRECRVYTSDAALHDELDRAGAEITGIAKADHVFLGDLNSLEPLSQINTGSDLYPDDGATVIIRAVFGQGVTFRFTGPGIENEVDVEISGLPGGFWQKRKSVIRYPTGFDLILVDQHRVICVPRSTTVEEI